MSTTKQQPRFSSAENEALHDNLRSLQSDLDEFYRTTYDRSLPLSDALSDRWQRGRLFQAGEGSNIYGSAILYGTPKLGRQVWIGPRTILDASHGSITIGDYCDISAGCHLYTHHTVQRVLSGGTLPITSGSVEVGACTYIGPNTIVQCGVTIGDHVIIGAGSFVNRDIPAWSFACGSPCRVRGSIRQQDDGTFVIEQRED